MDFEVVRQAAMKLLEHLRLAMYMMHRRSKSIYEDMRLAESFLTNEKYF